MDNKTLIDLPLPIAKLSATERLKYAHRMETSDRDTVKDQATPDLSRFSAKDRLRLVNMAGGEAQLRKLTRDGLAELVARLTIPIGA